MTAGLPYHVHISEREPDGSWEDCTWDTGLEWFRDCYDPGKPATHAEAQLIRKASGEPTTGGSNLGNLADGIKARYGVTIPARISNKRVLAELQPGEAAVLQGSMSAFGPTHRLSQYDRNFDGGHAVYLANVDGVLLWCDPEAPTSADVPVVVSAAEVTKFVNAFNGEAVIAPLLTKEATVPLTSYLPGYTADVKAGSNVRSEPRIASTKLHATTADMPVQVVGTVKGDVDPGNGSNVWYELWHENRTEYTAKDNIINLKAPVVAPPAPDCTAAVKAATDPLKAQLASTQSELAAKAKTVTEQAAVIASQKTQLAADAPEAAASRAYKAALKSFFGG